MGRATHRALLSVKVPGCLKAKSDSREDHLRSRCSILSLLHLFPLLSTSGQDHSPKPSKVLDSGLSAFCSSIMGFSAPSQSQSRPLSPPLSSESVSPARIRSRLLVPFLKCLALCLISILVLVAVLGGSRSKHRVYTGTYRRYQEGGALEVLGYDPGFQLGRAPSLKNVKGCPDGMEDFVPCYDVAASIKAGFKNGQEFERQCKVQKQCIVKPPKGYRLPPRWPTSQRSLWNSNLKVTEERLERILIEESVISFPSEESLMEGYVQQLEEMISAGGNRTFTEMGIRLALDIGCGMAAFSSTLLSRNVLTMSISAYEEHGAPVQFAQERGLPAMIGSISSMQLPFSLSAYDMIHCKDCGAQWHDKGGLLLFEVNRLLRPGGYFVWTLPFLDQSSNSILKTMGKLTSSICWSQLAHNQRTVIWQKTTKQRCYTSRRSTMCEKKNPLDVLLYQPLRPCVTEAPNGRWRTVQQQHLWPNRLMLTARRLSRYGMVSKDFNEDVQSWLAKLSNYWSLFTPVIFSDHPKRPSDDDPPAPKNVVRNIMDMNAQYGGFNAALLTTGKPVWVMNVVPTSAPNTLSAVFDRGLLGVHHDWCEAFPTYPRSYDLLYARSLLSQELQKPKPCTLAVIVLEMDRILRPEGWVLLQDETQVVETARSLLVQIRWEARIIEIPGHGDQRLLIGQKNWRK
ncbi:hypothetical protein SELMODRAFT_426562 [Selaginella moellendorffii]|uniref:Methyltransferase n=2 Tax=Selaginella moellendorffii TaxID=88036 RepID=D8SWR9_SELML|nr:probable methyltransferase PMT5 isoform X1 [Selaginella moellendorffii]EFJ11071.1 hypothetical protein SELMODRAFT_426562 [Selaginella moellendorffii]|eukprot:XP_002987768.1 probable methyltransferase PMT5 isoform X1 [Selaginella moellendorffii]